MNGQNKVGSIEKLLLRLACIAIFILATLVLVFGIAHLMAYSRVPSAEVFIGYLYKDGSMTFPQDNEKAKAYFKRAASSNDAEAQCALGEMYNEENNVDQTTFWYVKAALLGSERCEVNVDNLSFPDEQAAFKLLMEYANGSVPFAEFAVGKRYLQGLGVEVNIDQGIAYLEKASLNGHRNAALYLVNLYLDGQLVPEDVNKANQWIDFIKQND